MSVRFGRWISDHLVLFVGMLVLAYLFVPMAVVVAMSFNDPASRAAYTLDGFTLHNWQQPCEPDGLCSSRPAGTPIGVRRATSQTTRS